jgi:hypothetical protein
MMDMAVTQRGISGSVRSVLVRPGGAIPGERREVGRFKQGEIRTEPIAAVPLIAGRLAEEVFLGELLDLPGGGGKGAANSGQDYRGGDERLLEQVVEER